MADERDIQWAERIAVLELQVKGLSAEIKSMDHKLDELLTIKSKGQGAFWVASALFGTVILGVIVPVLRWFMGDGG